MLVSFVRGTPALLIKKEKTLVVGDLHIGMHLKLKESGIYFQNATEKMADALLAAYKKSGAESLVLLGDIKESIGSPRFAEYRELKLFFDKLSGIETRIVKGNHDGNLSQVMRNIGQSIRVEREVFVGEVALTHGNSWPSQEAVSKRYVVVGHGHYAMRRNGIIEKVWLFSKITRFASRRYACYNKNAKLIVAPSFNSLVMGSALSQKTKDYLPMFKNNLFSFENAKVYDMQDKLVGSVKSLINASR
jgi:putative SbcD/Mre11-related phosphoesterase